MAVACEQWPWMVACVVDLTATQEQPHMIVMVIWEEPHANMTSTMVQGEAHVKIIQGETHEKMVQGKALAKMVLGERHAKMFLGKHHAKMV